MINFRELQNYLQNNLGQIGSRSSQHKVLKQFLLFLSELIFSEYSRTNFIITLGNMLYNLGRKGCINYIIKTFQVAYWIFELLKTNTHDDESILLHFDAMRNIFGLWGYHLTELDHSENSTNPIIGSFVTLSTWFEDFVHENHETIYT